jgi:hypothetical protein
MLTHFREKQRTHLAATGMLVGFAAIYAIVAGTTRVNTLTHIIQWALVVLAVVIAALVREFTIKVDHERIQFGFGPLRRSVRLSCISTVRVIDADAGLHVGLGIHRTSDGGEAWIARRGCAVELRLMESDPHGINAFVLSTDRPRALATALQSGQTSRVIEDS